MPGIGTSPRRRLWDVEKDGKEIGEIVFLGIICAKGYYKDAVATEEIVRGGRAAYGRFGGVASRRRGADFGSGERYYYQWRREYQ